MNTDDLSNVGVGFSDLALGSQAVFRASLHAISHPGRLVPVAHDSESPMYGHSASAALLLALLDPDCRLWLSPLLASGNAAQWLRFHTGCVIVNEPKDAQFGWVARGDTAPSLTDFQQGSDTYPDQSATCIIDVTSVSNDENTASWSLTGPGIRTQTPLHVDGLPPQFLEQWSTNHAAFPRGVDLFFATTACIVGLPRTTCVAAYLETEH
jgi:alpha-D-ribose 1-methylphosphonate 5-triphosphate synthase subunit PhnH